MGYHLPADGEWRPGLAHESTTGSASLLSCSLDSDNERRATRMASRAIGKFTVLGTLGKGANSSILHIRCSSDGKQYALKVVPIKSKEEQKFLGQAKHEYKVAQLLDHPNLIKIYALETPRDWLFRIRKVHLLLEYINGKTLDKIAGLSIPRLVQIFTQVADGLVQMHR